MNNKKGETMVEVILSFLVVMIALAAFCTCFNVAMRLYMKSVDSAKQTMDFEKAYYKMHETSRETGHIRMQQGSIIIDIPCDIVRYSDGNGGRNRIAPAE